MSVKCDLYAVRCPFYFFQMSVYVCVPRPKDARPPTEGRTSPDRRTHVPRPKDACPSTEGRMSFDRRTQTYMSSIKRVKPRL
jgi:hypothetical protein